MAQRSYLENSKATETLMTIQKQQGLGEENPAWREVDGQCSIGSKGLNPLTFSLDKSSPNTPFMLKVARSDLLHLSYNAILKPKQVHHQNLKAAI